MSDLTRVQQQTEVGEGLAVGCLVAGVSALTGDDEPLDAAFSSALAPWPWASRYPSLVTAKRPLLGPVLRRSAGRRRSRTAQWTVSAGLFVPQLRDDEWDLRGACEAIEESTAVPARRWVELASTLVEGLAEGHVWRYPPTPT